MQSRHSVIELFSKYTKKPSLPYIESCHKKLLSESSIQKYLDLDPQAISRFKLGLTIRNSGPCLVIPYRDGNGAFESLRHIPLNGGKESWENHPEIPYWVNRNLQGVSNVFVVSSEIEAIKLSFLGISNIVAITSPYLPFDGLEGLFEKARAVYILVKNREDILKKYDLAVRIGLEKTFSLVVGEIESREALEKLLSKAVRYNVRNVLSIEDALSLISRKRDYREGFLTPWKSLNEKITLIQPGHLVVVSADPKIGKTTLCLNVAHHTAKKGLPVLFYCLEMGPEELAEMILRLEYGIGGEIHNDIIRRAREELSRLPFYFAREHGGFEDILTTVRESVKLYGVRLFVFDNLQFLLSDIDNWYNEASLISKKFKIL